MAVPANATPRSRRHIIVGGLAAAAAWIGRGLADPEPASAEGQPIVVGGDYLDAHSTTTIQNEEGWVVGPILQAENTGAGAGLYGKSLNGTGVLGESPIGYGVYGSGKPGVQGVGSGNYAGVVGESHDWTGVDGTSYEGSGVAGHSVTSWGIFGTSSQAAGVRGFSDGAWGVYGLADEDGFAGIIGRHGTATGVVGYQGGAENPVAPALTGVYGTADGGAGARGVVGATAAGVGVMGSSGPGDFPPSITPSTGVFGISVEGTGVYGASDKGAGVYGANFAEGIAAIVGQGNDGTAIHGHTGFTPIPPAPAATGVFGSADGAGTAVLGSTDSGVAVRAIASDPAGFAIKGSGRVRLEQSSGIATIAAGTKDVLIVPGFDLGPTSFVLATLQGSAGGTTTVHRVAINTAQNRFRIYLTANATVPVRVAWLVMS